MKVILREMFPQKTSFFRFIDGEIFQLKLFYLLSFSKSLICNNYLLSTSKLGKILIGLEKLYDIFHHQRLVILRKTTVPNKVAQNKLILIQVIN